eukprot:scaffold5479_cov199-Amphora_coffeaeformis.AAC.36
MEPSVLLSRTKTTLRSIVNVAPPAANFARATARGATFTIEPSEQLSRTNGTLNAIVSVAPPAANFALVRHEFRVAPGRRLVERHSLSYQVYNCHELTVHSML